MSDPEQDPTQAPPLDSADLAETEAPPSEPTDVPAEQVRP